MENHINDWPTFDIEIEFPSETIKQSWTNEETLKTEKRPIENISKPSKRPRFAELQTDALGKIVEDSHSKNTNYNTKWAITIVEGKNIIFLYL